MLALLWDHKHRVRIPGIGRQGTKCYYSTVDSEVAWMKRSGVQESWGFAMLHPGYRGFAHLVTMIVGKMVKLHEKLAWFEPQVMPSS